MFSAAQLDPFRSHPEVRRLARALTLSQRFHLYVLVCNGPLAALASLQAVRELVVAQGGDPGALRWLPAPPGETRADTLTEDLLAREVLAPLTRGEAQRDAGRVLYALAATDDAAHASPAWRWCFQRLNEQRNHLARSLAGELVLCVTRAGEVELATLAPDLWSIRSGTYVVELEAVTDASPLATTLGIGLEVGAGAGVVEDAAQVGAKVIEARSRVAAAPEDLAAREVLAVLCERYGYALEAEGRHDEARAAFEEGSAALAAIVEEAPERRDVRLRRVLLRLRVIAEKMLRGQRDEHVADLRERLLPEAEALGDERLWISVLDLVASDLLLQGEVEEALRVRREEQLPVVERIGDARTRANVMGAIAHILLRRGQLDEALRIRRQEQLPVYEHLGDVLSRAFTMGDIADILEARGQLDEALRIRREEQLPVFERLGHKIGLLTARVGLALTLMQLPSPDPERSAEIASLLRAAYRDAVQMRLPFAAEVRTLAEQIGLALPDDPA